MISAKTANSLSNKAKRREQSVVLTLVSNKVKTRCAHGFSDAMVFFDDVKNARRDNGFFVLESTAYPMTFEAEKTLQEMGYKVEKKSSWYEISW